MGGKLDSPLNLSPISLSASASPCGRVVLRLDRSISRDYEQARTRM